MTDVLLQQTNDDGEVQWINGQAVMSDGLETSAYLSMFGGNEQDSGGDATKHLQWWGNLSEAEETRHYRSELQNLIRSIPAIPANLRRMEDAAERDLNWMKDTELATFVGVEASIPSLNRVQIDIEIEIGDENFSFVFTAAGRAVQDD